MSAGYRFKQFHRALLERPDPGTLARAQELPDPPLWDLFCQLSRAEQAHALRVYRTLIEWGCSNPDLLSAALLHDVGKCRQSPSAIGKAAVVLVRAVAPETARRWGSGPLSGWRRPFAIAEQHPHWGADMIRKAGGSDRLAALVERHHEPGDARDGTSSEGGLLAALQSADGQN